MSDFFRSEWSRFPVVLPSSTSATSPHFVFPGVLHLSTVIPLRQSKRQNIIFQFHKSEELRSPHRPILSLSYYIKASMYTFFIFHNISFSCQLVLNSTEAFFTSPSLAWHFSLLHWPLWGHTQVKRECKDLCIAMSLQLMYSVVQRVLYSQ